MADINCFYFGVQGEMGRYLYVGQRRFNERYLPDDFPVAPYVLDGRLLPPMLPKVQGRAELIHCQEWIILTFWDSSFDARSGASSTFIIRGFVSFGGAVHIAKTSYPQVWDRFTFEVIQR